MNSINSKELSYRNMAWAYYCAGMAVLDKFSNHNSRKEAFGVVIRVHNDLLPKDYYNDKNVLIAPWPFIYLLQHSLELYMKGYLLSKGSQERQLKQIGHKLDDLAKQCKEYGFNFTQDERQHIKILDDLNKNGSKNTYLQKYPAAGTINLPHWRCICDVLEKLEDYFKI